MKSKLTLSIDSGLMEEINQKARLNKNINLSRMVEKFLQSQFNTAGKDNDAELVSMRGILKETDETINWKEERMSRLLKKHL